jgi:hypothetical protein
VNVLATDVTHVGIGVVIGEPETNVANAPRPVFATQNFFRKPGENAPPPARMVPVAKERIDAARVKVGRARVRWDPALERAAAKLARGYAAGRTPDLQSMVNNLDYRSVETHRAQSGDFEALTRIDLWNEPELDAGIAIATVQSGGKKTFLMVILVGKR